jgi:hypothetical protein
MNQSQSVMRLPPFAIVPLVVLGLAACGADDRPRRQPPSGPALLASLSVSKGPLTPAFAPDVHDYALPCGAGDNPLTFTAVAAPGAAATYRAPISRDADGAPVFAMIPEDSAVVIDVQGGEGATSAYWIRCLPADFPALQVTRSAPTNPGYYLLGNPSFDNGETGYAMVLDRNGTPVWYRRVGDDGAGLLTLVGKNELAYSRIFGFVFGIVPGGTFQIEDLAAGTLVNLGITDVATDQHEFAVAANGNYLLLSYPSKTGFDLSSLGIKDTVIADCRIEELAPDGHLAWSWNASEHLDVLTESTLPLQVNAGPTVERDVFHCNSIDPQPNGDLVVSMRHANAVLMVSHATGKVLWKLGGTSVNKDGAKIVRVLGDPEGAFMNQHDARILPDGHVSLFDNHTAENAPARGLEIAMDLDAGTARIVRQYAAKPPQLNSLAMGSFRVYATGERVVGWGVLGAAAPSPAMTEVDAAGHELLEIDFVNGGRAYRATKVSLDDLDLELLRKSAGRVKP